jgi:UDP-glucose 4-epimerase
VTFDNFSTGKRELITGGEIFTGDLMDKPSIAQVFKENDIGAVLHFASLIQVGESYINPQKYYSHNLISSMNLLETMLAAGVKNFIFSSSAAVYGLPDEIPIPESHPIRPVNPYGQTKYFVETILQDFHRAYDLNFVSLRYFNAAGADPDGRTGEMHEPETHLIPNILLTLLSQKKELQVYGTDFPTPDGTAIRDYIHVTDLAQAHILALGRMLESPRNLFINLGANKGFSVYEIIRKVEEITGKKVTCSLKDRRKGDPPVLLSSNQKAKEILGWQLQYSDIETIISTAWNWHSKSTKS